MRSKILFISIIIILGFVFWKLRLQIPSIKQYFFEKTIENLYSHSVATINPSELATQLDGIVLLDSRQLSEFKVSHLPNAQFVGYEEFDLSTVSNLPKNQKIVIYCSLGYRSEKIGEVLQDAGFTSVYNLKGGIFGWINEGHKVFKNDLPTEDIHPYNDAWGIWLNKGNKIKE